MQKGLDPKKLVFIDETWASTNMTPRYGRCERGKRLLAYAPFGHWKTTTFVAALRHDRITAPCVFDGPINGETFLAYVEQALAPTLSPGDIVIMDKRKAAESEGKSDLSSVSPSVPRCCTSRQNPPGLLNLNLSLPFLRSKPTSYSRLRTPICICI